MWIKKLPGIVANAAVLILNVFAILMIVGLFLHQGTTCLLYTSPSPRDPKTSRMPSSA